MPRDAGLGEGGWRVLQTDRDAVLQTLSRHPEWNVLDFSGAREGHLPYADSVSDFTNNSAWFDLNAPWIEYVPFVNADAPLTMFGDDEFDFIWASHIAEHVPDPKLWCSEISRIARAGAICFPTSLSDNMISPESPQPPAGHLWWWTANRTYPGWLSFTPRQEVAIEVPRQLYESSTRGVLRSVFPSFWEMCVVVDLSTPLRCERQSPVFYDWRDGRGPQDGGSPHVNLWPGPTVDLREEDVDVSFVTPPQAEQQLPPPSPGAEGDDPPQPSICSGSMTPERDACSLPGTVSVVMTLYKRSHLADQLEAVYAQTLQPASIYVVQNGEHVDASAEFARHREVHPEIPLHHVLFSRNTRYHGRFHVAYLAETEYVSVWDDDVVPGREWLEFTVEQSKLRGDALIGAEVRRIKSLFAEALDPVNPDMVPEVGFAVQGWGEPDKPVDFVGHTWTLRREHLRYYVGDAPFTYTTGEDIQLSFSLQKRGIATWGVVQEGDRIPDTKAELKLGGDEHASYLMRDAQYVRQLLICRLVRAGFKPVECDNCDDSSVVDRCIAHFEAKVTDIAARDSAANAGDRR